MEHEFVPRVASSVKQLVEQNSIIIVALPANGHKLVFDELVPLLSSCRDHKHVIISSQASLGALYLSQNIQQMRYITSTNTNCIVPTITSWGTTVCTARRPSGTTVDIKTIRKLVDFCTIPEHESASGQTICETLFPGIQFRPRDGLLAISLSNVNPQNHLAMALGNLSRMEKGEAWYQFENTTPKIGQFLEALDQERLEIADALGVDVKTLYEHFSVSFHVPIQPSISDMCQDIYNAGNDVYGPNTSESRYILEDCPFGLVLTVALGKLVNRHAKLHESGLMIFSAMYNRDFIAENDLLQSLDLQRISLEDLKNAAYTGQLPTISSPSFH
jgi:opine dehydrogenase